MAPLSDAEIALTLRFNDKDPAQAVLQAMLDQRDAAIDELVSKMGYLPEAQAILAKYGLL